MATKKAATSVVDRLITNLSALAAQPALDAAPAAKPKRRPDAIDAELARLPRVTAAKSLANSPEMEKFREAAIDAAIRNDAAVKLLGLVDKVVTAFLTGGI